MNSFVLVASLLAPTVYASAQQTVTIQVPGATKPIQGDLYGSGTRGVILTHGGGRTKESWRIEGSAHAQSLFDTDQGPRLMKEIL